MRRLPLAVAAHGDPVSALPGDVQPGDHEPGDDLAGQLLIRDAARARCAPRGSRRRESPARGAHCRDCPGPGDPRSAAGPRRRTALRRRCWSSPPAPSSRRAAARPWSCRPSRCPRRSTRNRPAPWSAARRRERPALVWAIVMARTIRRRCRQPVTSVCRSRYTPSPSRDGSSAGGRMPTSAPCPRRLRICASPPCQATIVRTSGSPSPVPDTPCAAWPHGQLPRPPAGAPTSRPARRRAPTHPPHRRENSSRCVREGLVQAPT